MLKKLFSKRRAEAEFDPGEEPARFAPPPRPTVHPLKKRTEERLVSQKGFDPYNSGTFKKKADAWERVPRK